MMKGNHGCLSHPREVFGIVGGEGYKGMQRRQRAVGQGVFDHPQNSPLPSFPTEIPGAREYVKYCDSKAGRHASVSDRFWCYGTVLIVKS